MVAGLRTPLPVNDLMKNDSSDDSETLEFRHKACYDEMIDLREKLEQHYGDMQDIEFTIEDGQLWMLQCRTGKRTGAAAIKMAVDMCKESLIDKKEALKRSNIILPKNKPEVDIKTANLIKKRTL